MNKSLLTHGLKHASLVDLYPQPIEPTQLMEGDIFELNTLEVFEEEFPNGRVSFVCVVYTTEGLIRKFPLSYFWKKFITSDGKLVRAHGSFVEALQETGSDLEKFFHDNRGKVVRVSNMRSYHRGTPGTMEFTSNVYDFDFVN